MLSISTLVSAKEAEQFSHLFTADDAVQLSTFNKLSQFTDEVIKEADLLIFPYEFEQQNMLKLLTEYRSLNPLLIFIVIVDESDALQGVEAFKVGAFDILSLPFYAPKVNAILRRAKGYVDQRGTRFCRDEPHLAGLLAKPIAISKSMTDMIALLHQVANKDIPVLFVGETGTGKNVMANYLHSISNRQYAQFLTVNCGAISPSLLESELFGHEKGSFTGALSRRVGLLEAANGGTLFLDEINSASPELQVRLLQFIQDQRLLRVGSRTEVFVDVQLIFATNEPLKDLVDQGLFRKDLYFRLNVFPIDIPALRERTDDISHLSARILVKNASKFGKSVNSCGPGVLEALIRYDWPGNVRELENVILRALLLCDDQRIELKDLPLEITEKVDTSREQFDQGYHLFPVDASLKEVERIWIDQTLKRYQGNRLRASETLGINPTTLWRKLQKNR